MVWCISLVVRGRKRVPRTSGTVTAANDNVRRPDGAVLCYALRTVLRLSPAEGPRKAFPPVDLVVLPRGWLLMLLLKPPFRSSIPHRHYCYSTDVPATRRGPVRRVGCGILAGKGPYCTVALGMVWHRMAWDDDARRRKRRSKGTAKQVFLLFPAVQSPILSDRIYSTVSRFRVEEKRQRDGH
jgi:hypothetical protein